MKDKVLTVGEKKYYILDELINENHYVMCLDVTDKEDETEKIVFAKIEKLDNDIKLKDITDQNEFKIATEYFLKNIEENKQN